MIDSVVVLLKTQNYIDDREFAKWFIEQRQEFKPMSKRRLQNELIKKGLDREIIMNALEAYDEDLACRTLAHQKRHLGKKKRQRYLLRQGFGWDLVQEITGE